MDRLAGVRRVGAGYQGPPTGPGEAPLTPALAAALAARLAYKRFPLWHGPGVQSVSWPGMGGPMTSLADAVAAYRASVGPAVGKSGAANPHVGAGVPYSGVNPHLFAGGAPTVSGLEALVGRNHPVVDPVAAPPVWRWY